MWYIAWTKQLPLSPSHDLNKIQKVGVIWWKPPKWETCCWGHFLFFLFCPKLFRISENVRTISENVRTFHLSEAKLMFSLLIFCPKNVFFDFLKQVFIRCSIWYGFIYGFLSDSSKTWVGYYMAYPTHVLDVLLEEVRIFQCFS